MMFSGFGFVSWEMGCGDGGGETCLVGPEFTAGEATHAREAVEG